MMNAPHAILLRDAAATMKRPTRHLLVELRNKTTTKQKCKTKTKELNGVDHQVGYEEMIKETRAMDC